MKSTTLLSVGLCGAGLFTAAFTRHPACSLGAAEVAIVDKSAPSPRTEAVRTVEASPKPAVQVPPPPKPAEKPRAPTAKDVDVTGSVEPTAKTNQGPWPVQADMITALDANPTAYTHGQFTFPTCLTCHTWQGYFEMGMKPAAFAVWRICWSRTQKSATPIVVRLVSFDNGGGNIVELGRISSANWPADIGIWNIGIDITGAFNGLVNAKNYKNLGWQVEGDGVSPVSFYLSRLELQLED